jgi:hypothetical protein
MKLLKIATSLLITGALFSSCLERDNTDWTFEQDNAIGSEIFQDVYKQVDETAQSDGNLKSCATVTLSDTLGNFPNTVTIDFGSGCQGTDGRSRTGTITATFDGRWRDSGTVVSITLTDYAVDGYAIEGTVTATNSGTSSRGYQSYEMAVSSGAVTYPNGNTTSWNGTTVYELAEGAATNFDTDGIAGITDDVYHIGGTINGTNRNGTPYTAVITEYLVRDMSCKWITQGRMELTPQNGDTRSIDFGAGNCDPQATFSLGDFNFNFMLP